MSYFEIAPAADRDLDDIAFFIAQDNVPAALRVLDAAHAAFERLAENPRLGQVRPARRRRPELRSWPLGGFETYIVYYTEQEYGIRIERVLHGARDADRELSLDQE